MMTKDNFNDLKIMEQIGYVNTELKKGESLRSISQNLNMSKSTFRERFKKIGYIYNPKTKQYYRNEDISQQLTLEDFARGDLAQATKPVDEVIQKYNKSISEVMIVKENNIPIKTQEYIELKNTLAEVKELIGMKEQLKEVIQSYNKNINIIDVPLPQELKFNKDDFNGEVKTRLIKVYDNVNEAWIDFCKVNSQFKMQDLYSIALLEFIKKYKK
ncbi:DUF4250 domain-containing protein [Clostridium estertheticum]|uniref:DUF4250 domain-containing protein n=1 Tax=Clostridium estertheticum TaxID=238834 RepID=UPI001CF455F3|nr:DUF4250 domain-containing protein [Clostridium estertheticum]MCB2362201.1 DUF4250 domain-containing protein [Clostridium estertheticum]